MAGDTTITLRMNNSELEKSNQLLDKYQQKVTVASRKSLIRLFVPQQISRKSIRMA